MTDIHFEPFVHLAGLTHDDVLIAWGGFYFQDPDGDGDTWHIVEDPDLAEIEEGRGRGSIGVSSTSFGDTRVEVIELDSGEVVARASASDVNHVWIRGLQPDTEYRYTVVVDGEPWAEGPRLDWVRDSDDERGRDLESRGLTTRGFPAPGHLGPAAVRGAGRLRHRHPRRGCPRPAPEPPGRSTRACRGPGRRAPGHHDRGQHLPG